MNIQLAGSKCDTCKRCIFEADGGDGNPAIYCSKGHWDGHAPPEPDDPAYNATWDDCQDYVEIDK